MVENQKNKKLVEGKQKEINTRLRKKPVEKERIRKQREGVVISN